MISENAENN